ncbi:MAG: hypothetical protein BroJett018_54780 [Chloroflexota bacterium]|nr:MAG: hypothetical protein BroJett018_54780 [Chloroflexota bacterium]
MHLGYFILAILIGWVYASLTEKPSTGSKVIGPWDMSELIRHALCVGGAVLGVIILVVVTNATKSVEFVDGDTEEKTVFLLYDVSGIAIGSIVGAVLAGDIWRVVGGLIGGGSKPPSTPGGGM